MWIGFLGYFLFVVFGRISLVFLRRSQCTQKDHVRRNVIHKAYSISREGSSHVPGPQDSGPNIIRCHQKLDEIKFQKHDEWPSNAGTTNATRTGQKLDDALDDGYPIGPIPMQHALLQAVRNSVVPGYCDLCSDKDVNWCVKIKLDQCEPYPKILSTRGSNDRSEDRVKNSSKSSLTADVITTNVIDLESFLETPLGESVFEKLGKERRLGREAPFRERRLPPFREDLEGEIRIKDSLKEDVLRREEALFVREHPREDIHQRPTLPGSEGLGKHVHQRPGLPSDGRNITARSNEQNTVPSFLDSMMGFTYRLERGLPFSLTRWGDGEHDILFFGEQMKGIDKLSICELEGSTGSSSTESVTSSNVAAVQRLSNKLRDAAVQKLNAQDRAVVQKLMLASFHLIKRSPNFFVGLPLYFCREGFELDKTFGGGHLYGGGGRDKYLHRFVRILTSQSVTESQIQLNVVSDQSISKLLSHPVSGGNGSSGSDSGASREPRKPGSGFRSREPRNPGACPDPDLGFQETGTGFLSRVAYSWQFGNGNYPEFKVWLAQILPPIRQRVIVLTSDRIFKLDLFNAGLVKSSDRVNADRVLKSRSEEDMSKIMKLRTGVAFAKHVFTIPSNVSSLFWYLSMSRRYLSKNFKTAQSSQSNNKQLSDSYNRQFPDSLMQKLVKFSDAAFIYLFALGPLSNLLVPMFFKTNPNNFYIDVGGALDYELAKSLLRGRLETDSNKGDSNFDSKYMTRKFHKEFMTRDFHKDWVKSGGALQQGQLCTPTRWKLNDSMNPKKCSLIPV